MTETRTLNDGRNVTVRHGVAGTVKAGDTLVIDGEIRTVEDRKFHRPIGNEVERQMVLYFEEGFSLRGDEAQSVYHLVESAPRPLPVVVSDFPVIAVLPWRGKGDHWVVACDRNPDGEEYHERYVTWEVKVEVDDGGEKLNVYWGHYFDDRNESLKDLIKRAELDRAES